MENKINYNVLSELLEASLSKEKLSKNVLYYGFGLTFLILIAMLCFNEKDIKSFAVVLSAGVVATTLIYHVYNYEINFDKQKNDFYLSLFKIDQDKRQAGSKLILDWNSKDVVENAKILGHFFRYHKSATQNNIVDLIENSEEVLSSSRSVLNFLEAIATLIKHDLVDESILNDYFKGIFDYYNDFLHQFIKHRQRTIPGVWQNFIDIQNKWKN
jgi:Domain of unknown function (DUF4760)